MPRKPPRAPRDDDFDLTDITGLDGDDISGIKGPTDNNPRDPKIFIEKMAFACRALRDKFIERGFSPQEAFLLMKALGPGGVIANVCDENLGVDQGRLEAVVFEGSMIFNAFISAGFSRLEAFQIMMVSPSGEPTS